MALAMRRSPDVAPLPVVNLTPGLVPFSTCMVLQPVLLSLLVQALLVKGAWPASASGVVGQYLPPITMDLGPAPPWVFVEDQKEQYATHEE